MASPNEYYYQAPSPSTSDLSFGSINSSETDRKTLKLANLEKIVKRLISMTMGFNRRSQGQQHSRTVLIKEKITQNLSKMEDCLTDLPWHLSNQWLDRLVVLWERSFLLFEEFDFEPSSEVPKLSSNGQLPLRSLSPSTTGNGHSSRESSPSLDQDKFDHRYCRPRRFRDHSNLINII